MILINYHSIKMKDKNSEVKNYNLLYSKKILNIQPLLKPKITSYNLISKPLGDISRILNWFNSLGPAVLNWYITFCQMIIQK